MLRQMARIPSRACQTCAMKSISQVRASSTFAATDLPARLFSPKQSGEARQRVIHSVDCHCGGLPARIVLNGQDLLQDSPPESASARRQHMMEQGDWLRKVMITEPRGYPCQNVDVVLRRDK